MDLLIPDSGLLFWMTLVFLIVFLILWKAGFPAIIKMVNDRKDYIDESLRKAHEANEKLANIQKEGESILQEAREKQAAILREAAETRDAIVLGMLAAFTVLALYTFGRAIYDIGRNDGSRMETGHAGRVELPTPAETGNHLTPYLYGTDKE